MRVSNQKRAIVTIAIGLDPSYRYGIRSLKGYAAKVGAELIVIRKPVVAIDGLSDDRHIAWLQKFHALQYANKFESILYVDADILITPKAPDIFQLMRSQSATCAMYDEGHLGRGHYVDSLQKVICQPVPENWSGSYFNAGVIYLCKSTLVQKFRPEDIKAVMLGGVPCPEQTLLNYLINVFHIEVVPLDRSYNFMEERSVDRSGRLDAHFIHYAGYSFRETKKAKRVTVMRSDFLELFRGDVAIAKRILLVLRDWLQGACWSLKKKYMRIVRRTSLNHSMQNR